MPKTIDGTKNPYFSPPSYSLSPLKGLPFFLFNKNRARFVCPKLFLPPFPRLPLEDEFLHKFAQCCTMARTMPKSCFGWKQTAFNPEARFSPLCGQKNPYL